MKCLIVDDNPDARSLVERVLATSGYRTHSVTCGEEALDVIDEGFDVVIMDLGMPGMTGAETMGALRKKDARIRLLVVSGFDDRKHILEAVDAGADGYLLKDEIGGRLVSAVQEVVGGKSPMSARPAKVLLQYVASQRRTDPKVPAIKAEKPVAPDKLADASGEIDLNATILKKS
jgi:two-component system nitrate/nitrite response regulator NarL